MSVQIMRLFCLEEPPPGNCWENLAQKNLEFCSLKCYPMAVHVWFKGVSGKGILSRAGDKLLLQLQAAEKGSGNSSSVEEWCIFFSYTTSTTL